MDHYRSTSEHGSLENGWLKKYKRTWIATEVQANMTRYWSISEHVSLALKRVKLWILSVPLRNETLGNHNERRNRQLLYTLQCSVFGLKSREATDVTYIYAQQTAEFVMPNEVQRNAKSMTEDTAIRSALVYKQEIHGIEGTSQNMWSDLWHRDRHYRLRQNLGSRSGDVGVASLAVCDAMSLASSHWLRWTTARWHLG